MEVGTVQFQALPVIGKNNSRLSIHYENKSLRIGRETVIFEHSEIEVDFTFYTRNIPALEGSDTQGVSRPEIGSNVLENSEIVQLRAEIHSEIIEQVNNFLEVFFDENPEAAEQVGRGIIPEYFNVDNTARRILNIYFSRYEEGQDREEFTTRAKNIIEQAYTDVGGLVGEFPDIVLDTRKKVMDILDIFAEGGDISDFLQAKIE